MLLYRIFETAVVGLLVTGSAFWLLGALAPGAFAELRLKVAAGLNRRGRPRRLRAFAARLAAVPAESAAGCGSGCASCSGCSLSRVAKPQPVEAAQTL